LTARAENLTLRCAPFGSDKGLRPSSFAVIRVGGDPSEILL
jgi:hypothetical protein